MTSIALPRLRTIQPHVYALPVVRELPPVSRPGTHAAGW
jgi:hypothetical protein